MASLATVALVTTVGSNVFGAYEARKAGSEEKALLLKRAAARRAEGGQAIREASRQGRLKQSRAMALVAASGASMADPTMINLIGDLDAEAKYEEANASYEAELEAQGLAREASLRKRAGNARAVVGLSTAVSGVLNYAERKSLAGKYGG